MAPIESTPPPWRSPYRWLISLALFIHVLAVALAPFHFATQGEGGSSPLTDAVRAPLRQYIGALYLEHGYFFFAPNPGPNHLVRYEIKFDDGRETITGRFPDLKSEWPRLLYHRHFMLSESLNGHMVPPEAPPEPPLPPEGTAGRTRLISLRKSQHDTTVKEWSHQRKRYEALKASIVAHLEHLHPGGKVTITRVEHLLPSLEDVLEAGRKLDDPILFRDLEEQPERVQPPTATPPPRATPLGPGLGPRPFKPLKPGAQP